MRRGFRTDLRSSNSRLCNTIGSDLQFRVDLQSHRDSISSSCIPSFLRTLCEMFICYNLHMSDFTFVDELPPKQSRKTRLPDALIVEFAEACKDNPGKWCVYPKPVSASTRRTYAASINYARATVPGGLGNGEFEADASRGDAQLWVRYKVHKEVQ